MSDVYQQHHVINLIQYTLQEIFTKLTTQKLTVQAINNDAA